MGDDGSLSGIAEDAVADVSWVASRGSVSKRTKTCTGGGRWREEGFESRKGCRRIWYGDEDG